MLAAWRAYWHQQTRGIRETMRDLYRHYQAERDRIEGEAQRHDDDVRLLADIVRAQHEQQAQIIDRHVRILYEQSRFGRRRDDPAA